MENPAFGDRMIYLSNVVIDHCDDPGDLGIDTWYTLAIIPYLNFTNFPE